MCVSYTGFCCCCRFFFFYLFFFFSDNGGVLKTQTDQSLLASKGLNHDSCPWETRPSHVLNSTLLLRWFTCLHFEWEGYIMIIEVVMSWCLVLVLTLTIVAFIFNKINIFALSFITQASVSHGMKVVHWAQSLLQVSQVPAFSVIKNQDNTPPTCQVLSHPGSVTVSQPYICLGEVWDASSGEHRYLVIWFVLKTIR